MGYDLDSEIPDHSVLSKARKRWGMELFKEFFERIVWQCVQAGLVDGSKIFMDGSLIDANAANGSIMDRYSLKAQLSDRYPELERRLTEIGEEELAKRGEVNQRYISLTDTLFAYDAATDTYRCPAGNTLKRKSLHQQRESIDYAASKRVCDACELRAQCTRNKAGRSIKRHLRQEALDAMRSRSPQAKRDIRTRQHLMERSFARGTRFGFDHARWRGRNKVQIQEYLSAAIQNIEVLIRYGGDPNSGRFLLTQP